MRFPKRQRKKRLAQKKLKRIIKQAEALQHLTIEELYQRLGE